MAKYRKRPVVIEAVRYSPHENCAEVAAFLGQEHEPRACRDGGDDSWLIETLEGTMKCSPGDWVVRGVHGEFYPVKDAIFRETYEAVEDAP